MKFILNENKKFILEERFILKESEILTEDKTPAEKLVLAIGNLERWVPSILEALPKVQTLELDDNLKALFADVLKILEQANLKYLIAELKENAALYQADKIGKERHKGILGLIGDKLTGDFQSIITNIENIQKSTSPIKYTLEKLQQKLNDTKAHMTELQQWMEENKPVKSNSSDEDWAAKYNAAVNKDAVWEEYLNTVWADNFDKVFKIQEAFRRECISYGFDDTNPFFTFIKNIYLKYDIKTASYNAIHNAVAGNDISTKDLLGKSDLGFYNLIFCKDLYLQDPANIKAYLEKQKQITAKDLPEEFDSKVEFVYNIFYQTDKIVKQNNLQHDEMSLTDLKLNTFATINRLEQKWTGEVSTETNADQLFKDSETDSLIQQISSTEEAAQLLVILNLRFAGSQKLESIVNKYREIAHLMTQSTTSANLQKLIKQIESKFKLKNITEAQAITLATKILASNKFKFTRE